MHLLANKSLWSRDLAAYAGIKRCHQCGACTAACPRAGVMHSPPARTLRLLQLGLVDETLFEKGVGRCIACGECTDSCPMLVDVQGIIRFLRRLRLQSNSPGFSKLTARLGVGHTRA